MGILYRNEHKNCSHCTINKEQQLIVMKEFTEGTEESFLMEGNEVALISEGKIWYTYSDIPPNEVTKGEILFLPEGGNLSFKAIKNSVVIVLRVSLPIKLCDNFSIEDLYEWPNRHPTNGQHPGTAKKCGVLHSTKPILKLLNDLHCYMDYGINCKRFHEIKIKEFFLILRSYYSKDDLYSFFRLILSSDVTFTEHVRLRWGEFKTVGAMAQSLNLSTKQFSEKFKVAFGTTPYKWMIKAKAKKIMEELMFTDKSIKLISIENEFNTMAQFSNFCKTELGDYPSEIRAKKR